MAARTTPINAAMPPRLRARRTPPSATPGFTLVEVLVALAIAALLLLAGGTTVQSWLPRYEQRNAARALADALHDARAEALKRNARADLCPTVDGATCDSAGRWERGWLLFADSDGDGDRDAPESVLRVGPPARPGITVRGNRPVARYVSFTPFGHSRLASGALQMGTFVVCRAGQTQIEVVLANGGRPRIQETTAGCP